MRILNKIRYFGFQLFDSLKGRKISNNIKEIDYLINNLSAQSQKRKDEILNNLLNNAVNNTLFYSKYKNFSSIQDFPVINKNLIKKNYEYFRPNSFKKEKLVEVRTSGSTGAPFEVLHNKGKRKRNTADVLFFAKKIGYKIGDPIVYVKIWTKHSKKQKISFLINNQIPVGINDLSDKKINEIIKNLNNKYKSIHFIGYVSAIESICSFVERKSIKIKFKVISVTTMSESLDDRTRKYIEKILKTKVYARYSNNENGIIAQQVDKTNKYLINSASFYVEVLDFKTDKSLKEGELGRIVITDLFNYAMPLIRYDTGDVGVLQTINDIPYLTRIEGRKMDVIYDTKGEIVSSYIVSELMWDYTELKQYQFIQEGEKDYLILLNVNKDFKNEQKIISDFMSVLGNDANIKVKYIDEIPLLASGKRKRVENRIAK